jgi:hypothetical protein
LYWNFLKGGSLLAYEAGVAVVELPFCVVLRLEDASMPAACAAAWHLSLDGTDVMPLTAQQSLQEA